MLPLGANEAADVLAEVAMITTVEVVFLPAGNAMPSPKEEASAVEGVLPILFSRVLGEAARVALEPHALEARRRIPTGFAARLFKVAVRVWPIPAMVARRWPMPRAAARS